MNKTRFLPPPSLMNLLPYLAVALLILFLGAAAIVPGWLGTKAALAKLYGRTPEYEWTDEVPVEPGERGAEADEELRGLGYEELGWLIPATGAIAFRVYAHGELPAYTLLGHAHDASGVYAVVPQMETFLPGLGRLSTTAAAHFGRFTGGVRTEGPRLVQIRTTGKATPTALDGQHLGTLRAWQAGGRAFLPASREALIEQLQADHQAVGTRLAAGGWLSLADYVGALAGKEPGSLKF